MATIKIPTPLRVYTDNQAEIEVQGATVAEALMHLVTQYPDLKTQIYNGDTLRSFVNIYVGDEDIRFLDGADTEIKANANLRIIPTIAGGR